MWPTVDGPLVVALTPCLDLHKKKESSTGASTRVTFRGIDYMCGETRARAVTRPPARDLERSRAPRRGRVRSDASRASDEAVPRRPRTAPCAGKAPRSPPEESEMPGPELRAPPPIHPDLPCQTDSLTECRTEADVEHSVSKDGYHTAVGCPFLDQMLPPILFHAAHPSRTYELVLFRRTKSSSSTVGF